MRPGRLVMDGNWSRGVVLIERGCGGSGPGGGGGLVMPHPSVGMGGGCRQRPGPHFSLSSTKGKEANGAQGCRVAFPAYLSCLRADSDFRKVFTIG
jgi:hypothetical protein